MYQRNTWWQHVSACPLVPREFKTLVVWKTSLPKRDSRERSGSGDDGRVSLSPRHRGTWHQGAGGQQHWGPVGRLSSSVMMETLLQERYGRGDSNPGCHQILSAGAGKSQARGLQADSRQLMELELPLQPSSGRGEVGKGDLQAGCEPAVGHAASPSPCTGVYYSAVLPPLPTSTPQLITTDCLLILSPLGQGCPASQTALCPASCNSLINYHSHERQGLLWVLRASFFATGVKCKAKLPPFTRLKGPVQAACLKRHLVLCSYWVGGRMSPFRKETSEARHPKGPGKGGGYL